MLVVGAPQTNPEPRMNLVERQTACLHCGEGATLSRRATFDALNLCVAKLPLEDSRQDVKIKLTSGESPGGLFCTQVASPSVPGISASVGPGWGLRIYLSIKYVSCCGPRDPAENRFPSIVSVQSACLSGTPPKCCFLLCF